MSMIETKIYESGTPEFKEMMDEALDLALEAIQESMADPSIKDGAS